MPVAAPLILLARALTSSVSISESLYADQVLAVARKGKRNRS